MNGTGLTIAAIQRTNIALLAVASIALALMLSRAAAVGCLIAGSVVIANLYLLAVLGKLAVGVASGGALARRAGVLALPLKLFLIVALLYLVFARVGIDALGFGVGVLTQFVAILIETGRAATHPMPEVAVSTESSSPW
jgi:hypothetical protein